MPLKSVVSVLFSVCMLVVAGCGTEVVQIGPMPGGDGDVAPDGDSDDVVLPDGDNDEDPDITDGIELPEGPELPESPDGDTDPHDTLDPEEEGEDELPWELEVPEEDDDDHGRDYDYLDSEFTEFSAPECVEEPELAEIDEARPVLVFDEPVLVSRTGYTRERHEHTRVVDLGNDVVLAMWEDSRYTVMYALSDDGGQTWSENNRVPRVSPDLDHASLLGLGVGETAAVAFVVDEWKAVYSLRLSLPVADINAPEWDVMVNTQLISPQSGSPLDLREVAVVSADVFMLSWRVGNTEYYAKTTDGGETFTRLQYSGLHYAALPDGRFLLMTSGETGIKYRAMEPDELRPLANWEQLDLGLQEIHSLHSNNGHVVLLGKGTHPDDIMRSDFDPVSFSFGEPFQIYSFNSYLCNLILDPDMRLNRDGRISYLVSCFGDEPEGREMHFGYQETPSEHCSHKEFYTESPKDDTTATAGLLLESGMKLGVVTSRTILRDGYLGEGVWWQPETFYKIRVYSPNTSGPGLPGPAPMLPIATINDDPEIVHSTQGAHLAPLPGGDVGVAWQTGDSVAVWANSLQQARAGKSARWLYNLPELYGNNNYALSPVEPVWIDYMGDLITWDGRSCMVTYPAINATEGGDSFDCRGVAFSCFYTWSAFMEGNRPGPLEMLLCDPDFVIDNTHDNYLNSTWISFVQPGPYGKGFAMLTVRGEEIQRGMLFYDEATRRWPYVQFVPELGYGDSIGRLDESTMLAWSPNGILYSYDEGQSWTPPSPLDIRAYDWQIIQRSDGTPGLVMTMGSASDRNRGNVSALVWDCEIQEWKLFEFPELDVRPFEMRAIALDHGDIAVLYGSEDRHALYTLILNPDTGYRSEPVSIYSHYEHSCMINLNDMLYHDGVLSVAYLKSGYCGNDVSMPTGLYVTQARIEYE